jgi:oligopeptide transport system ATP-binding protein
MNPLNPYTQALMSAVPVPDPVVEEQRQRIILEGDIPSPSTPPTGCNFNTRCPVARDICFEEDPAFIEVEPGHYCACHVVEQEGRAEIG